MVKNIKTFKIKSLFLLIVIAVVSLIICAPFPNENITLADDAVQATMHADNQTIHRGQTFDVDIEINDNKGLLTLFVTVKFNHNIFTLTNVQQVREALGSLNMEHSGSGYDYIDEKTGGFNLIWDGSVKDKTNGRIARLTFESKITAPLGTYPVEFVVDKENTTSAYNVEANVQATSPNITLTEGAFIVVWHDWDGTPVHNTNITGHPYNELTGGYEYASEESLNFETDFPNAPTRETDAMYSYTFSSFKGAVWHGDVPEGSSVIYYVADYISTPQKYVVWYYVDGFGEDNTPDGIISDEELFTAKETAYNENIDENVLPYKHNYTFYGWYKDKNFTQKLTSPLMPAEEVKLYGYFKYNIRETDVPEIQLKYRETITNGEQEEIAYVDVFITKNYGLSSLFITLAEYDKTAFTFCGFEKGEIFKQMSFWNTNDEGGVYPDGFSFSWNNSYVNSYETGRLLVLKFKMNKGAADGAYEVVMTSDNVNTTYVVSGEIWYSDVKFTNTKIPIGSRNTWKEPIPNMEEVIEVESDTYVPYNVEFVVKVVSTEAHSIIDSDALRQVLQDNNTLYNLFDIYYEQNATRLTQEEFAQYFGDKEVVVKIKLTAIQQSCKNLRIYYVDNSGQMYLYDSEIKDGYLIFKTNHFSNWALIGDYVVTGAESVSSVLMRFFLSFFGIAASALIAIMFAKSLKKQPLVVYSDKEREKTDD